MTGNEKRGYLYSAISFCINPIWGLVQGALNFGYFRWADKQQGLDTIASEYYVKTLGITVQTKPRYDGKIDVTSRSINCGRGSAQFPVKIEKSDIYEAVSSGEWVPVYEASRPSQSRA